jgi:hypothetical protein
MVVAAQLGWSSGCTGMDDAPTTRAALRAALHNEVPAPLDTLLDKFDRTVFYSDSGRNAYYPRNRLEKWAGRLDVMIVGSLSSAQRQFVEEHFAELVRLTGLQVRLRAGSASISDAVEALDRGAANFLVAIDSRGALDRFQVELGTPAGERWANNQAVCFFFVTPIRGRIVDAFAAIPNVYQESLLHHCILEETTQALGLFADSDMIQPSLFSERTPPMLEALTLNDKIILRALYDPRIRLNMRREKALELAQEVIAELVETVEQDGVEGLYQR